MTKRTIAFLVAFSLVFVACGNSAADTVFAKNKLADDFVRTSDSTNYYVEFAEEFEELFLYGEGIMLLDVVSFEFEIENDVSRSGVLRSTDEETGFWLEEFLNGPKSWGNKSEEDPLGHVATGITFHYGKLPGEDFVNIVFVIVNNPVRVVEFCRGGDDVVACASNPFLGGRYPSRIMFLETFFIPAVITHEVGHSLGLDHNTLNGVMTNAEFYETPLLIELLAARSIREKQMYDLGYIGVQFPSFFSDNRVGIAIQNDRKMVHIDKFGKPLYNQRYDYLGFFYEGLAYAWDMTDGAFCINLDGERVEESDC